MKKKKSLIFILFPVVMGVYALHFTSVAVNAFEEPFLLNARGIIRNLQKAIPSSLTSFIKGTKDPQPIQSAKLVVGKDNIEKISFLPSNYTALPEVELEKGSVPAIVFSIGDLEKKAEFQASMQLMISGEIQELAKLGEELIYIALEQNKIKTSLLKVYLQDEIHILQKTTPHIGVVCRSES